MKINKDLVKKSLGGISISLSLFALLFVINRSDQMVEGAKYALGPQPDSLLTNLTNKIKAPYLEKNSASEVKNGSAENNSKIVEGFFETGRDGDLIKEILDENDQKITNHYRAIYSAALKNHPQTPQLKLQVYSNEQDSWIDAKIELLDSTENKIYFLLKQEQNGKIIPQAAYTGAYRIIFP